MNPITPLFLLFLKAKASGLYLYLEFGFMILDQNISNMIILSALSMPKKIMYCLNKGSLPIYLLIIGSFSSNIEQQVGLDGNKMRILEIIK